MSCSWQVQNKEEWDERLSSRSGGSSIVVAAFWKQDCAASRRLQPFLDFYTRTYPNLCFLKVEARAVAVVARECGVVVTPTFQVYKDGSMVDELVDPSLDQLGRMVEKHALELAQQQHQQRPSPRAPFTPRRVAPTSLPAQ